MITCISPTYKMRKAIQSYLRDMVVKIPMSIEIRKGVGSRKTSQIVSKKHNAHHFLYSDGAYGGVVLNTALLLQSAEYLPPSHDWLHACDVRRPESIPAFEKLYAPKRGRRSRRPKNRRPDHNPMQE